MRLLLLLLLVSGCSDRAEVRKRRDLSTTPDSSSLEDFVREEDGVTFEVLQEAEFDDAMWRDPNWR